MHNDNSKFKTDFYKRLVKFAVEVIKYCAEYRKNPLYWSICDQLIRSASSVGANVTEAKSSSSKREYIKYFEIALKSANETLFWFDVMNDVSPSNQNLTLHKECSEIAAIIASGVIKMKGKKNIN